MGLVFACTQDDRHIRYELVHFMIFIPTGSQLLVQLARIAGITDDFEHSWDGFHVYIYPQLGDEGEEAEEESEIGMAGVLMKI